MYHLRCGTRMLQSRNDIRNSTFTLYNTRLNKQVEISKYAAWLIRYAHKNHSFERLSKNAITRVFLNQLRDIGFLSSHTSISEQEASVYLGKQFRYRFPLTALNIELTNMCNLRCKHCYGSFSDVPKPEFVPYEWIKESISEFNNLHVRKIALTGGEATLHPQFLEIAIFLMEQGFDLCVFTNGYNYNIIKELLERGKDFHFTIKVSLDGLGDIHNQIRGKERAYSNAVDTIELISQFPNVTLYISTTVLPENLDEIDILSDAIKTNYPNGIHTKDLVFPMGNADTCTFSIEDLPVIDQRIPSIFLRHGTDDVEENNSKPTRLRCTGGVSQCTLMPDGSLKICNAACDKQFYFKHNAYKKGLKFAWIHCGNAVRRFRHERTKETDECQKCEYRQACKGSNCRVLAWAYTGDANRSNPLTCFATRKAVREEQV